MFKGFWKIDKSLEESRFTQLIGLVLLICVGILHDLEILMRQLLGCADRGVYHIELIGGSYNDSDLPRPSPLS